MPEFIEKLRAGNGFVIGGVEFKDAGLRRRFMQADDLHPTAEGLGILARLCADATCEPSVGAKPTDFKLELAPLLEALRKLDASRTVQVRVNLDGVPPKPEKKLEFDGDAAVRDFFLFAAA